jgi:RHS repeat-associated protein
MKSSPISILPLALVVAGCLIGDCRATESGAAGRWSSRDVANDIRVGSDHGVGDSVPVYCSDLSVQGVKWNTSVCSGVVCRTVSGPPVYGARFYSGEVGRWLSRDPIGEETFLHSRTDWIDVEEHAEFFSAVVWPALANLYRFVDNNAMDSIDPWGDLLIKFFKKPKVPKERDKKGTYKVGKCEIVLFYGHGWINFFDGVSVDKCGGTTAVTCQSQIIFQHLVGVIPGAVDTGGHDAQWGGIVLRPGAVWAHEYIAKNVAAMKEHAKTLCKAPCCCKEVQLKQHCVGTWWQCHNLLGGGFYGSPDLPYTHKCEASK